MAPRPVGKNRVITSGLSARLSVSVFVSVSAPVSASVSAPVSSSTPSARPRPPAQETCRALNATAPVAKAKPQRQEWHGLPLHDPYAWLRADNWQEVLGNPEALDKEIMALLQAEGMHSEEVLAAVKPLRAALFVDLKSRIAETEESVKRKRGTWLYWKHWRTGSEYPVHLRAPRSSQETTTSESPEVVLDEAVLAEGKDFFRLLGAEVSPDQKSLAFVADLRGQEHGTLRIRRITGREDGIDAPTAQISTAGLCNGDFAFTADGTGLYYVRPDENHRPSAVWLHRLGRDAGDDRLIWHEADPAYFVSLERQASSDAAGGVILLHLHDHAASEYRLLSACPDDRQQAGEQEETVACIFSRRQVVQAEILHDLPRKRFLILREEAQGQEFRLDALSEEQAQAEQGLSTTADTLLAVQAGQSLISLEANQQRALLIVNQAGRPALGLLNLQDDSLTLQAAPEAIGALALAPVLEYEADELFFSFLRRALRQVSGVCRETKPQKNSGKSLPQGTNAKTTSARNSTTPAQMAQPFLCNFSAAATLNPNSPYPPFSTAMVPMGFPSRGISPSPASPWWIWAGNTPPPAFAAAMTSDDTGTARASLPRKKTASTTSSLLPVA